MVYLVLSHNLVHENDVRLHCFSPSLELASTMYESVSEGDRLAVLVELVSESWGDTSVRGGGNLLFWREGDGPHLFRVIRSNNE